MQYKVNPLSKDALRRLAQERLVVPSAQHAAALSIVEVQRLLEDLAINRIELEIQNEYLQETYARVKQALARANDLYDFAPVGCFSTNAQGLITSSNLVGSSMLGLERSSLINRSFESFLPQDQRAPLRKRMALAMESGENQRCELTVLGPHALCRYMQLDLSALAQGDGCQLVLTDATSRKTVENQLREDAQRCEFAMDAVGDCLWDWNLLNGVVRYSPQISQLYGYALEELGNSMDTWRALVHPDNQSCFVKGVQQCLSGQHARFACELRVQCKDGSHKWILCRGAVFSRTADGVADRLIGTHTDITGLKTTAA
jgi:PAS domain S-box-containing protein